MGHRAARRHAVELIRQRTGRALAAADVRRARTEHRGIAALRPSRTKFKNGAALRRAGHAVGLRGNQALMVQRQKQKRLDDLRLDGRGADRHDRLVREDGRPLRDGPDVAGESVIPQRFEEPLAEHLPPAQIRDVVLVKMELLDIADGLLQTGRNSKAAAVRHRPEEDVEIRDAVLHPTRVIAVGHGQLVVVAEHRQVHLFFRIHIPTSLQSAPGALF